jgi:hypothetical protein
MANLRPPKFKADSNDRPSKPPSILSAILSAIVCLIISASAVFLATACFGVFTNIVRPLHILELGFLILPASLIGIIAFKKFSTDIRYLRHNYSKLVLAQVVILGFSLLLLAIGITQSFYHRYPANNFRAYVKEREYVVHLIETKQLKVDRLTQTSRINQEKIFNLPEKYQGLSRNGQVRATGEGNSLEVIFSHTTIGFGRGERYIIYRADGDKNKISFISYTQRPPFVEVEQLKNQYTQRRQPPFVEVEQLKNQWFSVIIAW